MRSWCIESHWEASPQRDGRDGPDAKDEDEQGGLVAGVEPYLDAPMLPLPAESPEELVGRSYSFPQTPDDEAAPWDRGAGWLFFCLYMLEHDLVYPTAVSLTERQGQRYRVKIWGRDPIDEAGYDLGVEAWLDWFE